MANPVLGKSLCSDWFFLDQDFAVRTMSSVCIFVLERSRQIKNLQPKQRKKNVNIVVLHIETTRRSQKDWNFSKISKMDEEDQHLYVQATGRAFHYQKQSAI